MPAILPFVLCLVIAPAVSLIVRHIPQPVLLAALSAGLLLALIPARKAGRRS